MPTWPTAASQSNGAVLVTCAGPWNSTESTETSRWAWSMASLWPLAERLEARAIVTLDVRDFGAVTLKGQPQIWPRDL